MPARSRRLTQAKTDSARRSPCPVSCCLDIVGDRWTLLVVRDLFLGRSRFKDFTASPEAIPTNVLAERLQRLLQHGLVIQAAASEGSKHLGYQLTDKGKALLPVLKAMKNWGLTWERGTKAALH
ncbi:MAG: helix-turn-helix transcriptional regulator [Verrucomicrobia bacterium]|nr:helix-turn-helix transcriptional regulator [Verrucomicrobiota bacterium]